MLIKDPEFEKNIKRSRAVSEYCYNQSCNMIKEIQEMRIESEGLYEEACNRLKDFKVKKHSKEMDTVLSICMLLFQR